MELLTTRSEQDTSKTPTKVSCLYYISTYIYGIPSPQFTLKELHYSQYDKIIKENLEITLPVVIRDILGLDILVSEELPDDVQHTKERKPDALKKVTDTTL